MTTVDPEGIVGMLTDGITLLLGKGVDCNAGEDTEEYDDGITGIGDGLLRTFALLRGEAGSVMVSMGVVTLTELIE